MKVVIVKPGKRAYVQEVANELSALQEAVGGYIEVIPLDENTVLICNEEGKLLGLEPNRKVGDDIIVGTFLICGTDGEEFRSLLLTELLFWLWAFNEEEGFNERK